MPFEPPVDFPPTALQIGIKVGEKITMHESKHRLQALTVVRCPSLGTFTDYSIMESPYKVQGNQR